MRRIERGDVALLAIVVSLMLVGPSCTKKPKIYGGYIPKAPEGFLLDVNATSARTVFDRDLILSQRGYFNLKEDNHCSISITKFDGLATRDDVENARDDLKRRYGELDYTEVEPLTIDDRPAWGWMETQWYKGKVSSLEYKGVVTYDDATYSVEFYAADPQFMDKETLKAMVATFRVGKDEVDVARSAIALIVVLAAVGSIVVAMARRRDEPDTFDDEEVA